jgi:hypothetical protein
LQTPAVYVRGAPWLVLKQDLFPGLSLFEDLPALRVKMATAMLAAKFNKRFGSYSKPIITPSI